MKKFLLLHLSMLVSVASWGAANIADFRVPNADGVEIYYVITSTDELTVSTTYTGNTNDLSSDYAGDIVIPETVEYDGVTYTVTAIGSYTFYWATNVTSITMPNSIISIENYALDKCDIRSLVVPNNVTTIGNYSIANCSNLTELVLGKSLETIKDLAFSKDTSLATIYSLNPMAPDVHSAGSFTGVDVENCVLYVPAGSEEVYATAITWSNFLDIRGFVDPTVQTMEVADVTEITAVLMGSITEGTFEITEKGFEYQVEGGEVQIVVVSGDEMTATIEGLEPGTTYTCRAYATTVVGTTYGEDIQFSTLGGAGSFTPDVDPESGSDVTELYDNITFYNPTDGGEIFVNDYCEEVIEVYSEDETLVTQQAQFYPDFGPNFEEYSQTVYFEDRVSEEGTYYVNVPAELFIIYDEEGKTCYNEAMTLTYTITADSGDQEPNYELVFNPEDGSTLDILSTISISCEDGITRVLMPDEEITIVDSEGNNYGYSIVEVADDTGFVTEVDIILSTEIVDAGTYYVNVPVGYFDIGQSTNNAFTLTYTITGTLTGLFGISINDENVEGIYSIGGQKIGTPQKGVNIIRYNDGTTKKVLIK